MNFIIKEFSSLSAKELFDIYKLRSEVFIVEQNCVYQDIDDKDLAAFHVMLFEGTELIGYSRLLASGLSYTEPSIGRVILKQSFRKTGLGKHLMKYSISKCLELFKNQEVVISAQSYLLSFYRDMGFKPEGDEYLEDEIPHTKMRFSTI